MKKSLTERIGFENKPWKEWKTRKATLVFIVIGAIVYTGIGIFMNFIGRELDSTLTVEVFSFFKWLAVTGCLITVSKVIKGKTNSDCDEEDYITNKYYNQESDYIDEELE